MTPSPQRWKEKLSSEKRQYFSRTVAMPGRGTQGPPGLVWRLLLGGSWGGGTWLGRPSCFSGGLGYPRVVPNHGLVFIDVLFSV